MRSAFVPAIGHLHLVDDLPFASATKSFPSAIGLLACHDQGSLKNGFHCLAKCLA